MSNSGFRLAGVILCVSIFLSSCGSKTYEVRYELNGGTLVSGKLLQEVKQGDSAQEPETERSGYLFQGWSESSENIRSNKVIVADWEKLYKVQFNTDNGKIISGQQVQELRLNETPEPPVVEKENFDFIGWDPEVSSIEKDTVYVAQWKKKELSSEEIYKKISPGVAAVYITCSDGSQTVGSGFFVDDQGTLVTNYHVIDRGVSGHITFSNKEEYEILGVKDYDESLDLAILDIDCLDNPYLETLDSAVETGEKVYTIGAPLGLDDTFSDGIISKASREIEGTSYIQVTAPVSEGNSGGPLVNSFGKVIGINTLTSEVGQNLNFAIDVKELQNLDKDNSDTLTLEALTEKVHPASGAGYSKDSDLYDLCDREEIEPNDSFSSADVLNNGMFCAGAVPNIEDKDFYYIKSDKEQDVTIKVFPEYVRDVYDLYCFVVRISAEQDDEEDWLAAVLEPEMTDDGSLLCTELHLNEEEEYFLFVVPVEENKLDHVIYYAAVWNGQ